jgi:VIT1/CCC1 family predicted Fe2+/Mn2+ transporter
MTVRSSGSHERVLDPVERLSEVLFGLIMVLSFTCSISAASAGEEEVRSVVIGAIGCNLAWGIVDAVMYLLTLLLERGRSLSTARLVHASQDPERGRRLIAQSLPEPLDELLEEAALEGVRAKLAALPAPPARPSLGRRDWRGALGVFLLVFLSTFPVVVPFLILSPLQLAMRVSNGVAIGMLFVAGYQLGRYAGLRPLRTALVMVTIGLVLVGVTIALGG